MIAKATEAVQARSGSSHGSHRARFDDRRSGRVILHRARLCCRQGVQAHHDGSYLQWDICSADKDIGVAEGRWALCCRWLNSSLQADDQLRMEHFPAWMMSTTLSSPRLTA